MVSLEVVLFLFFQVEGNFIFDLSLKKYLQQNVKS